MTNSRRISSVHVHEYSKKATHGTQILQPRPALSHHRHDEDALHVGVVAVNTSSPSARGGIDNLIRFTTTRHQSEPHVITGPGLGAGAIAAGVFADVLTLAKQRRWRACS